MSSRLLGNTGEKREKEKEQKGGRKGRREKTYKIQCVTEKPCLEVQTNNHYSDYKNVQILHGKTHKYTQYANLYLHTDKQITNC